MCYRIVPWKHPHQGEAYPKYCTCIVSRSISRWRSPIHHHQDSHLHYFGEIFSQAITKCLYTDNGIANNRLPTNKTYGMLVGLEAQAQSKKAGRHVMEVPCPSMSGIHNSPALYLVTVEKHKQTKKLLQHIPTSVYTIIRFDANLYIYIQISINFVVIRQNKSLKSSQWQPTCL